MELYDHNPIFRNEMIGQYSIGLSTLYRHLNHEFYKTWVTVFHPDEPNIATGFLQLSCFIVGDTERPPVHGADEDPGEALDMEDDEDILKMLEAIKRAQGLMVVSNPNIITKCY